MQVTNEQARASYLEAPPTSKKSSGSCISSIINFISNIFKKILFCFSFGSRSVHISINMPPRTQVLHSPNQTPTSPLEQKNLIDPVSQSNPAPAPTPQVSRTSPAPTPASTPQVSKPSPAPTPAPTPQVSKSKPSPAQAVANTVTATVPQVPSSASSASAKPFPTAVEVIKTPVQTIDPPIFPSKEPLPAVANANTPPKADELSAADRKLYKELTALSEKRGLTIFHLLHHVRDDVEQAKRLIDYAIAQGININEQNNPQEWTPLHTAVHKLFDLTFLDAELCEKILEALYEGGGKSHSDPIPEIALYLIAKGANLYAKDKNGAIPLVLAGNLEIAKTLLDAGTKTDGAVLTAMINRVIEKANDTSLQILQFLIEQVKDLGGIDLKNDLLKRTLETAIDKAIVGSPASTKTLLVLADILIKRGNAALEPVVTTQMLNLAVNAAIEKNNNGSLTSANAMLAIAEKLVFDLRANFETADFDEKKFHYCALENAIKQTIGGYAGTAKALLDLADKLVLLGAKPETTDPEGKLLNKTLKAAIDKTIAGSSGTAKNLLSIAEKLVADLRANFETADSEGKKFHYSTLENAIDKTIADSSGTAKALLDLADMLVLLGAKPETTDPEGKLLNKTLKAAIDKTIAGSSGTARNLLSIAEKLVADLKITSETVHFNEELMQDVMKRCLTQPKACKNYLLIVETLIRCGIPKETTYEGKTLSELAAEYKWIEFAQFLNTFNPGD